MKNILKVTLSLSVALCLLLGCIPSVGALWDFSNGIPEGWERQDTLEEVSADDILQAVNPNASQEAKSLLAYLQIVGDSQQVISGQFDIDNTDGAYQGVINEYGYEPVIYSARYKVDSVTEPTWELDADGKETTTITSSVMEFTNVETANALFLEHYKNGNILLVHSDSAPRSVCAKITQKNKPDEYEDATDAIKELDATNPDRDMQSYALWLKYQASVISALKALEDSGVKAYLWRPWIEYNVHAFCGKTEEGFDAFVRVYQQTVNMLVEAGLTGFLVCFSPASNTNAVDIRTHNPGTDYIDTYAFTLYSPPTNLGALNGNMLPQESLDLIKRSGKPLGFSEISCRTGTWQEVDNQARASCFDLLQDALTYWPQLSWYNFWSDGSYDTSNEGYSSPFGNDDGMLFWSSDFNITLDEAVDYQNSIIRLPGIAQLFTTPDASGDYVGLAEKNYTADELKDLGISAADVRALRLNRGFAITFWTNEDCTGKFYSYGFSEKNIKKDVAKNFKSLSIVGLENVALWQSEIYASVNDAAAWKANDGMATLWEGNVFDESNLAEPGTAWLYIDLGKAYHVGRYALKNASFGSRLEMYNTVDFQLQYSNDAVNWTVVDQVFDNTLGQVDRYFKAVMARYFRLLITNPNKVSLDSEKGMAMVAELELYGVDPGELSLLVKTEDAPTPQAPSDEGDAVPEVPSDEDIFDDTTSDSFSDDTITDDVIDTTPEEELVKDNDTSSDEDDPPKRKKVFITTVTDWTWVVVLGVAGLVLVAGGIVLLIVLKRRKKNKEVAAETEPPPEA